MSKNELMSKNDFKNIDWGETDSKYKEHMMREFSQDGGTSYEFIYPVRNGDVVLAIGESIGPFTWSIMNKAKTVIALEPSKTLYPILVKNCSSPNTILLNKAFGEWDHVGVVDNIWLAKLNKDNKREISETGEIVCLETIINDYKLDRIDFIKTDCEGGEYSLFTNKNMPFLLNNVRNIVGEWHLNTPEKKVEFRYFRDKYLKQFKNYELRSVDGVDIKWDLWNDHFLEYYEEILIYISNE
jgi:FkbM family methyltransferase|tara:strand:+ start:81 stop:803 length:723 start_codon:yes stop_codon:yes gene_type:complete